MNNSIQTLLTKAINQLSALPPPSSDTARLDAELLMSHTLRKPRSYLFTWPEKELSDDDESTFSQYIEQRVSGVPVAYLTGQKEFWSLDLKVNDSVLIPRSDTELIVELALSRALPDDALVADLGTGSGAIALAMASDRKGWHIYATDQSTDALAIANENAAAHKIHNVMFLSGSWCQALGETRPHMIVTNPPYICQNDHHLYQGDVRFEPLSALASGSDGLNDIRQIIKESAQQLMSGGWLLIEHGFNQGHSVAMLLGQHGYTHISIEQDLSGHNRVTMGQIINE